MLSSLRLEKVALKFEQFVRELRSFLKESGLAYGFPEHLLSFTERLSTSGSLRSGVSAKILETLSSMVEPASHGELVELLLVTVGGPDIEEEAPAIQRAERVLSQLVGEVMTSQSGLSSMEHAAREPAAPSVTAAEFPALAESPTTAEFPALTESSARAEFPDEEPRVEAPVMAPPLIEGPRPAAVVWASPPPLVWAALVCGVLLPPGMYLLSRPHGPQVTTMPKTALKKQTHAVPLPMVPPATSDQTWAASLSALSDLSLDPGPTKKGFRSVRLAKVPAPLATAQQGSASTLGPTSKPLLPVPTDRAARETDMPGRDFSASPAPPSAAPQEAQQPSLPDR